MMIAVIILLVIIFIILFGHKYTMDNIIDRLEEIEEKQELKEEHSDLNE